MLTSSKKVSYSYARRILILPVAIGILVLLSFTIKDSLSDVHNKQVDQSAIAANILDTIPAKYRDPKTGQIKGSFEIDIDGDTASFKDIKSKKELFKLPLNELAGPANKKVSVEGSPLYTEKKITFISYDSMPAGTTFIGSADAIRLRGGKDGSKTPRIIINGKEISPGDLDKIDPTVIKTINIIGDEKGDQKVIMLKMDTVSVDGSVRVAVPAQGNISVTQVMFDTTGAKTVTVNNTKSNVSTMTIRTSDDKIAGKIQNDPNTLTFTTTDKEGKKTYTFVQKTTEKSELPKDVLYIIDGKEMPSGSMKDLDPNTIKMVNVLKGEAATKKYGEKAKNGVVEITTKK